MPAKYWKKHPKLSPQRDSSNKRSPPSSKRPRINILRVKMTTLYTHAPSPRWILDSAATSHTCWDRSCFSSLRPYRDMLGTTGDPYEPDQCAETDTIPLLGGSTPVEHLYTTLRTDCRDFLPCDGPINPTVPSEQEIP
ncbi:hypothetical protein N7495_000937 [Penicillium taxi]|uniref:uncharacterized protein n=1 Tax=Penicillium taxi TaxID=168475 RepID=UPI0025458776|nr:uncharacterized protein N7495_000937 [Penicillium taxi]KAJ5908255.1 hypothetical protein N7495_000937 [Penicillium taxi]